MANQRFSASEREALWLAHGKKCAYTREPIDISNFHIDHILPEFLADKPDELEIIRKKFKLGKGFDLRDFENLIPCKPRANLQKGSLIFEQGPIYYFLGIAASKKPLVKKNLEQIEKRHSHGRSLILLQQCLEHGELSPGEIMKIVENYGENPQEIFNLIEGIKFYDATVVHAIAKDDIDDLRSRPLRLGENDKIDGVTLTKDSGEKIFVRTCKEYDAAISAGYYALTNFDIKMSVFFEHQCGLLKTLKFAKTPDTSFIEDPRAGIADLHLLPFSMFPQIEEENPSKDVTATYQSKVDDGTLIVKRLKQNMLCVEEIGGMGQQLIEVVRADFNSDGIEDILLFEYCYATQGTLGFGGIKILTRKSPNGLFEIESINSSRNVLQQPDFR